VEAPRGAELTGTNRPCGLTSFSKANIAVGAWSRAEITNDLTRRKVDIQRSCALAPKSEFWTPKASGGYIEEAIPDPISNSEVKLFGADGTARATVWESRTLPG
jgi:hypothetical protein